MTYSEPDDYERDVDPLPDLPAIVTDPEAVARLRRVLEFLTEHPQMWDQGSWMSRPTECGTAGCLAGWMVHERAVEPGSGVRFEWEDDESGYVRGPGVPADMADRYTYHDDTEARATIRAYATHLLGLEPAALGFTGYPVEDAISELFDANNTLGDLWYLAAMITGGAIVPPDTRERLTAIGRGETAAQ